MKHIIIAGIALLAAAQAVAETPEDRCHDLAEYAHDVAMLRDQGVRLAEIKELNHERATAYMAGVYDKAAEMVYRSDLDPAGVQIGMLNGCMETVNSAKR